MNEAAPDRELPAVAGESTAWQAVREHLLREKDRIVAEIRSYPPPIAGCDAQYQFLTERRHLIARELVRLQSAQGGGTTALDDFIASSAFIDVAAARRMRARVRDR